MADLRCIHCGLGPNHHMFVSRRCCSLINSDPTNPHLPEIYEEYPSPVISKEDLKEAEKEINEKMRIFTDQENARRGRLSANLTGR
jgi:hypothetical protein